MRAHAPNVSSYRRRSSTAALAPSPDHDRRKGGQTWPGARADVSPRYSFSFASIDVWPGSPHEEPIGDPEDDLEPIPPIECACEENREVCKTCPPGEAGWFTASSPRHGVPAPPREAGWWTGNWYTGSNTIMCDGGGSLTIHEATNYLHGVQECTRRHEAQHMRDWYARYGNDICNDRARGDLPYFDPPGKPAYSAFRKASECAAWRIGRTCRQEKHDACGTDECRDYVRPHVEWAENRVTHYCGS